MKLNWHAPAPPTRSGIADFTAAVLPALMDRFTVELWTDRVNGQERVSGAPVRYAARDDIHEWDIETIDIYNMGNNFQYHRNIFDRSLDRPGIVLMHDTTLIDFFLAHRAESGADAPSGGLYEHNVAAALDACRSGASIPEPDLRRPLMRAVLKGALCGVAFTSSSFEHIKADASCPAYRADLPLKGSVPAGGAPDDTVPGRLVLFGILGRNRRIPEILRAIASHPRRDELTLHVYGTYDDPAGLEALIRTFDLSRRVVVHGYVPDDVLDEAIRSAALVLNLRFPSMGEASASQLRAWSLGKATVVTPVGWYAELPPDAVLSAPLSDEQGALREAFTLALDEPARLRAVGENGRRRLVDRHRPEHFGAALAEVIADLPALRARWTVRRWTARCLAASAGWRAAVPTAHWARVTEAMAHLAPAGFADD